MPSYGKKQKPAGVDKSPVMKKLGMRKMKSINSNIECDLYLDSPEYKGNATLNAQK
jgi:hypothetical protein